jgi:hypothetical protein
MRMDSNYGGQELKIIGNILKEEKCQMKKVGILLILMLNTVQVCFQN